MTQLLRVDEATRTILARARIANADLKLRPGMFGRVQLQLAVREKAIWIPEQAIVPKANAPRTRDAGIEVIAVTRLAEAIAALRG